MEYEGMMYFILKKYGLYDKREDYIDVCYLGYAKALNKYDKNKSKKVTYIFKCIENELSQQLRKENTKKSKRNDISLNYIIDETGWDLEKTISNDVDIENDFLKQEDICQLYQTFSKLNKREQYIIKKFFGINCEKKTQSEIGLKLGISQMQVSRLKDEILIKMRGMMEDER